MTTNTRFMSRTFAGFILALCLFQGGTALAQTQEPAKQPTDVEQLKQRLQQLEQTVSDLKGQLTAIEEAKKKEPAAAVVEAKYSVPPPAESPESVATEKPQNNGKGESTFQIYGFATVASFNGGAGRIFWMALSQTISESSFHLSTTFPSRSVSEPDFNDELSGHRRSKSDVEKENSDANVSRDLYRDDVCIGAAGGFGTKNESGRTRSSAGGSSCS